MYNYNFKENKFWSDDIVLKNDSNHLNPYLLSIIVKNEFKKINNNKYFYILNIDSFFIIHKLNNILLCNYMYLSEFKKIEYANFLIIYLLKYLNFFQLKQVNIIELVLQKIYYFLKTNSIIFYNKKQSYNFCKYNYKCKSYYIKKKCNFDHYPYKKLCIDIKLILHKISSKSYNVNLLKKYIVTIHYVLNNIYDEYFMYRYINNI